MPQIGPSRPSCETTPSIDENYNLNKPVNPFENGFVGPTNNESPQIFTRQTEFFPSKNNMGTFQNNINQNDAQRIPDPGIKNLGIQTEEYKTTHKFNRPENNGFTDEYAGPAMEQVKLLPN